MSLEDKVGIIIGASSGIGEGIAYAVAEQKPRGLVLAARTKEKLDAIAQRIGGNTIVVPTDVTKEEEIQKLFRETITKYGTIDFVVNSAGIIQKETPIEEFSVEEFRKVLEMNLVQAYAVEHLITPRFKQQGNGIYVVISSQAGEIAFPGEGAYNASKAGVNKMIASADLEWQTLRTQGQSIHAFALGPGFIDTPEARKQFPWMTDKEWERYMKPIEFAQQIVVPYLENPEDMYDRYGAVNGQINTERN